MLMTMLLKSAQSHEHVPPPTTSHTHPNRTIFHGHQMDPCCHSFVPQQSAEQALSVSQLFLSLATPQPPSQFLAMWTPSEPSRSPSSCGPACGVSEKVTVAGGLTENFYPIQTQAMMLVSQQAFEQESKWEG